MIETFIYIITILIVILIPILYILREKKKSRKAQITLEKSVESGRNEPVSLHPFINPDKCIGTGACVNACPENDVLGLINNRGQLVNPGHCIGHGMCKAACPVDAIDLVIGTEKRGVDIPHISGRFETNVEGIYIAGELGGMGLIGNAVEQGRQASGFIAESLANDKTVLEKNIEDLVIIGAGPAGISAALQAKKNNLNFRLLDQEDLGGTVLNYPRGKLVMTRTLDFPLYGKIKVREIQKEELLSIFQNVFSKAGLKVYSGKKVENVVKENGYFRIDTNSETFKARKVLLTIGRRGSPRKLNVEGEKSGKVAYRLIDPEYYRDKNILVVGGGDSAVEAAVALSGQSGNNVTISYRKQNLFRIKEENQRRFDKAVDNGKIIPLFNSEVQEIERDKVILLQNEKTIELKNDQVFIMIGGELPAVFLEKIGIKFTRKFGERLDDDNN